MFVASALLSSPTVFEVLKCSSVLLTVFHTCYATPQYPAKQRKPCHVYPEQQPICLEHARVRENCHPLDAHMYESQIKELKILSVEMKSVVVGILSAQRALGHGFFLSLLHICAPKKGQH